jgi:hypothetical protein
MKLIFHLSMISILFGLLGSLYIALANMGRNESTDPHWIAFFQTDKYIPLTEEVSRSDFSNGLVKLLSEERAGYEYIFCLNLLTCTGLFGLSWSLKKSDHSTNPS